jgi:hypothetical protein
MIDLLDVPVDCACCQMTLIAINLHMLVTESEEGSSGGVSTFRYDSHQSLPEGWSEAKEWCKHRVLTREDDRGRLSLTPALRGNVSAFNESLETP